MYVSLTLNLSHTYTHMSLHLYSSLNTHHELLCSKMRTVDTGRTPNKKQHLQVSSDSRFQRSG